MKLETHISAVQNIAQRPVEKPTARNRNKKFLSPPTSNVAVQNIAHVMLCYMVICKAPLTGGYSEALSA